MNKENEKNELNVGDENVNLLLKEHFYTLGAYKIDIRKRLLVFNGVTQKLTTKEYDLLIILVAHANEMIKREYMIKAIWGNDTYGNSKSIDVYIFRLRKLLKDDPDIILLNIHGKGLKLITP